MERWRSFASYCKETYGRRLYRVPLDAGMTCPVRDGTKGTEGCTFCAGGSGSFAIRYEGQPLKRENLVWNHREAPDGDHIAYFQAYTNTYAPLQTLRRLFTAAMADPLFCGIDIATRPDCIDEECYALLGELKEAYPDRLLWVELGLQTIHPESIAAIRRGYDNDVFIRCVHRLAGMGIPVIVHVIIGLPGESETDNIETVRFLSSLPVSGIKLQLLHILKGSVMGRQYEKDPESFHVLSKDEYIHRIVQCLGHLRSDITVHRLTGDGDRKLLLAPLWSTDKKSVLNGIRHRMKEEGITQGVYYGPDPHQ